MITLERWEPIPEEPQRMRYMGQRTAQEVFEELRQHLESMGYLPDEYFMLDADWENGREIPEKAGLFCTADYGESEGIYLDVYLKWYEQGRPITKSFITGKTLGENGDDLDRMYLIASAITKAFQGDNAIHSRYICLDEAAATVSGLIHLDEKERRTIIDALISSRNQAMGQVLDTERLLRRVTGSITEYVNEMGQRPLQISAYDTAVLAVQDGNLEAFADAYPKAMDRAADLLAETTGRAGTVGRKMAVRLLADCPPLSQDEYLAACDRAVRTGDQERMAFLMEQAPAHIQDMSPSFYGDMLLQTYYENKNMARALLKKCTPEQIAAAPGRLLLAAVYDRDERTAMELLEKGIPVNKNAADILRTIGQEHLSWLAVETIRLGRISPQNFSALQACIDTEQLEAARLLLDQGMDYNRFQDWMKDAGYSIPQEAADTLDAYWREMNADPKQDETSEMGEPALG